MSGGQERRIIKNYKYHIFVVLIGAAIVFRYALFGFVVGDGSDASREYQVYQVMINGGILDMGAQNLLLSCFFTTAIPAFLQKLSGFDALLLYKVYICLIVMWLPLVVYLLARRFMDGYLALMVAVLFMAQPYYLAAISYARIMIAVLFFALLLLTFLENIPLKHKAWLVPVLSLMVVLSHYGTTYVVISLLTGWLVLLIIQRLWCKWRTKAANA